MKKGVYQTSHGARPCVYKMASEIDKDGEILQNEIKMYSFLSSVRDSYPYSIVEIDAIIYDHGLSHVKGPVIVMEKALV